MHFETTKLECFYKTDLFSAWNPTNGLSPALSNGKDKGKYGSDYVSNSTRSQRKLPWLGEAFSGNQPLYTEGKVRKHLLKAKNELKYDFKRLLKWQIASFLYGDQFVFLCAKET